MSERKKIDVQCFMTFFFPPCKGDGYYRAVGSHVIHQLLKEVSQHHLWASSDWGAVKCKYHRRQSHQLY